MNNITRQIAADYTTENGILNIKGLVNLDNWNANSAVTALNTECGDLHKGSDGVSKLWSEVEIEISATLVQK